MERHSGQHGEITAWRQQQHLRRRRRLLDARALAEAHLTKAEARGNARLAARYAAALLGAEAALAALDAATEAAEPQP